MDDLSLIASAAKKAGEIALKYFNQDPEIWYKGASKSPVSEADLEIDQYLKEYLLKSRPNYGWLSEETIDNTERLSSEYVFVVDPIDGTRAFIAGTDEWCVSIAIVKNGRPIHGVLYAPIREKLYTASQGQGAQINGEPYDPISPHSQLQTSARVIIPSEVSNQIAQDYVASVEPVDGARSLALRIVGLLDGYVDAIYVRKNSRDWDMVASDVIICEAGYKLVDLDLNDVVYNTSETRHGVLFATRPSYIANMNNAYIG